MEWQKWWLYGPEKGMQWSCGLEKGEWLLLWVSVLVGNCVFQKHLSVHVWLLYCGIILSVIPVECWPRDMMTSFLVYIMRNLIGIRLPVL